MKILEQSKKIQQNKAQYHLDRKTAKTFFSTGNVGKY